MGRAGWIGAAAAAVALACAGAGAGPALPAGAAVAEAGFIDGFERFDPLRWYVSDGWRNGSWQDCDWSARSVALKEGALRLSYLPAGGGHGARCGEVQTRARYLYGTFEARLRWDAAPGRVAAFFTYAGPSMGARHEEIDVELPGAGQPVASLTVWRDGARATTADIDLDAAAADGFVDVGFVWAPGRLTWYLAGRPVLSAPAEAVPTTPQKIMLSHWGSASMADWLGRGDPGRGATALAVDFVSYTPPGAPCLWQGSVACERAEGRR
ncbi:MAG: family 16 glycosylhydrolase [Rhodobacteraceae bacterium]|nr:family 16 glycosylhydrolase [Paracoccaceae bacterium]